MKDYLKNPNLYFAAAPVAATIWMLFILFVSLPAIEKKLDKSRSDYNKAQDLIAKIAQKDPDRLHYKTEKGSGGKFDYSNAIEEVAKLVKIPSPSYQARKPVRSGGKDKQSADITIDSIDIESLARFVSQMLLRWSDRPAAHKQERLESHDKVHLHP